MDAVPGMIIVTLIAIFYLLPAVIAAVRRARHGAMIFCVNLFFGWTVLGWLAALIWAVAEKEEKAASRRWSEPFYADKK